MTDSQNIAFQEARKAGDSIVTTQSLEDFPITKRLTISKVNFKKIKIAIEALELEGKESGAMNEVVNNAIECYYKKEILPKLAV